MKKLIKFFEYVLFIIFIILFIFTKQKYTILLALPILFFCIFLAKRINKHFIIILFVLSLLIKVLTIIYLKVPIVDDFKTMYDASISLLNHDLSFLNTFYFTTFSYQLGHVLYQTLLLKMINSVLFLKIINVIITTLIAVFIYLISKELSTKMFAKIVSLFYLLYLYPLYLNAILTNQHLPALLTLIVIYLIIKYKNNYKVPILIAILLVITNILRTESIIIIVSLIIYYLITINKKTLKYNLISIGIISSIFIVLPIFINLLLFNTNLHTKLENKEPLWKIYCGLNYEYNGRYNEHDQDIYFNNSNHKDLLIERIKEENIKIPILFLKKEVILWTQTNYDVRINNSINTNILFLINQGILNLVLLLFLVILYPTKKKTNNYILLIKIILFVYFGAYLFIEVSPRYAYILHILIFLLLGNSLKRIDSFNIKENYIIKRLKKEVNN